MKDLAREAKNHVDNPPVDQATSEAPSVDKKGKGKVYQPSNEAVETEIEPIVEPLPIRRKEKSISSLVGGNKIANQTSFPIH